MAIAGKVAITPGGEWSESVAYDKLVVVTYNNDLYLSKKANTGVTPTDTENWQLLIKNVTQEQYEAIINGTTPVGNALQLGSKSASEYALNVTDSYFQSGETILSWASNPQGIFKKFVIASNGVPSDAPIQAEAFVTLERETYGRTVVTYNTFVNGTYKRAIGGDSWISDWIYSADGGNANTVDGFHANELLKTLGLNGAAYPEHTDGSTPKWQDAPIDRQTWYYYEGADVEAYNLPTKTCTVIVNRRNSGRASALAIEWTTGKIWSNGLWDTWKGWKKAGEGDYLPLDGSVPMSGNNFFIANGYGGQYADGNSIQIASRNTPDGNTARFLEIKNSNYDSNVNTALLFRDMVNGVITDYALLHSGNSAKVVQAASAPSDTTALWYDTVNKAWKRYAAEYGAWQV